MSIPRKSRHPARDADASEARQGLISNRHNAMVDDCGDTLTRVETLARLGEPIVGEPWPSDLHIDVEYRFDKEPARATRSLGVRVHVSKRSLLILVLVAGLACGTLGRNTAFVKKMLTTVAKVIR
jgi:hypothetical protein